MRAAISSPPAPILFEMLAGRPAFDGRTVARRAPRDASTSSRRRLTGSPAVAAIDRVIRQALAKRPSERLPSAEVMAEELRAGRRRGRPKRRPRRRTR